MRLDAIELMLMMDAPRPEDSKRAIIFGSVLGSFCVEDLGTRRLEKLRRNEVHERYQSFKELTDFAAL